MAGALPFTTFTVHVDTMERVGEAEAPEILKWYRDVGAAGANSTLKRIVDVFTSFHDIKYVRVLTPAGEAYYRLRMRFPWFTTQYRPRADFRGAWPVQDDP